MFIHSHTHLVTVRLVGTVVKETCKHCYRISLTPVTVLFVFLLSNLIGRDIPLPLSGFYHSGFNQQTVLCRLCYLHTFGGAVGASNPFLFLSLDERKFGGKRDAASSSFGFYTTLGVSSIHPSACFPLSYWETRFENRMTRHEL